ncbi:MAG: hypothetical protein KF833_18065 [Verrucomicrobiae bacterium]|nr:hypothetical protein [Verrucomicrobiae bacterium]
MTPTQPARTSRLPPPLPRLPPWLRDSELQAWQADLHQRVERVLADGEQGLGFLEEHIEQASLEPRRLALERALQAKAEAVPCLCTTCQGPLRRLEWLSRSIRSRFGPVEFARAHGWCARCQTWSFPADLALGLAPNATASPFLQEAAALLVSKMPPAQAEAVAQRLLGVPLTRCSLDREARRQGQRAQKLRAEQNALLDSWDTLQAEATRQNQTPSQGPFTLILEIDAWNIRERDDWGDTEKLRALAREPERWHWVYTATCFRLDHRGSTAADRPVISERGYVATRLGIDELFRQLHREAVRRGLWQAADVLVIADGAVWIWNAVADRFPKARQRLDLFHLRQHLWEIAHDLHGRDTPEARAFVQPLLTHIHDDRAADVIAQLDQLRPRLAEAQRLKLERQTQYLRNNLGRMHYQQALAAQQAQRARSKKRAPAAHPTSSPSPLPEPVGSGAIESTARQYQCRFKRTGQFWTQVGDEALLCLETLWRNQRWTDLFPHARLTAKSRN